MSINNSQTQNDFRAQYDMYNESVAPVKYSKRTVSPKSMVTIWFSMAVQLAIFMVAGLLYPSLTVSQIFWALLIGNGIVALIILFSQDYGIKYGLNFAVATRSIFGYKGCIIPQAFRAAPAIFWFGYQTWIGAMALDEIGKFIFNGYSNVMLWIVIFGAAQIVTTFYGIGFIRVINTVASPVLLIMGCIMIYLMLSAQNLSFGEVWHMGGDGSGATFSAACMAFVGGLATLAISICDITKDCEGSVESTQVWHKQNMKFFAAQWVGMVPASCLFGFIGALSMALTGEWNPIIAISIVIGGISVPLAISFQLFILLATWTTNGPQNLFNPAYTLSTLFPKKITYKIGVGISGVVGLAVMPWNASEQLVGVLGIIGALLGPATGILICDYFLIRNRKISLGDLYYSKGVYTYTYGFNMGAMIALALGVIAAFLNPNWMYATGLIVSGVTYYPLMKLWVLKKYPVDAPHLDDNDKLLLD